MAEPGMFFSSAGKAFHAPVARYKVRNGDGSAAAPPPSTPHAFIKIIKQSFITKPRST